MKEERKEGQDGRRFLFGRFPLGIEGRKEGREEGTDVKEGVKKRKEEKRREEK
jgi:hypothetical protein